MSTAVALRYRFYAARVRAVRPVGASLVRVTFGGEDLVDFAGGGRDQSVSLFLPHPGQAAPVVPVEAGDNWHPAWRALDPQVRAVMRSYTIRAQRPERGELDIDFVRHGDTGPATRWAGRAAAGDPVLILGPAVPDERSVRFQPPAGTDGVLLVADETALPAVGAILDWLPAGTPVRGLVEVPEPGDIQPLPTEARAEVTWLVRGATAPAGALLPDALRATRLPGANPYTWLAGEAGMVRAARRHLVGERGLDRRRITFAGYWRRGASEDDLRAEAGA
ncbi:siderophore-interacting protein [Micromonospora sp. HK10]|uniref:siderophore-interacting protein n=1 Tax=Micromonospora sp. HK10 TaxID=1538294 RepID=UPI0006270AA3|nr:siderophore-interacting protein [Micromonospora sp. HK10]KKJ97441.1 sialic acid transporter [Micromonospora sp. HK10]